MQSNLEAQESNEDYEEITVFLAVQSIGGYEVTAIYKNEEIFLPVSEMFQCLKINQKASDFNDSISGFFLTENNRYIISQPQHSVFVDGKLVQLSANEIMISEASGIALRIDQYGKLFGLDCKFNFNSLTVELKTSHELPVLKELRVEQMRKNISRLQGEISVDTTYERRYHLFRGGMADWALFSTQVSNGTTETRALLGLGAELLGGETNIELNYSSRNNFDKRQQQYHWRWANNRTKLVKQVTLGKINSQSVASIYSPLIGTVITNAPTTYRRSFGSYAMSDFTEPGWTVELYINNVIVDYTTADASGFFKFNIPLVYGASNILLKFYGPWGEERQREQRINVPYNFLPKGEFQYSLAGAVVQDSTHSIFSRGDAHYGINRFMTVGGGYEYLSSISTKPYIPFVNGSAQMFTNLLLSAEYAYGVRTKGALTYNLPSNLIFDIDYTKYELEQKAITFNYLEERRVRLSIPITTKKLKAYTRFAYSQNILKETVYSTTEATISTFYKGISANFTGNANWIKNYEPYIYGNLGLGFRFFKTLAFRPQIQYDFSNNNLIFTKVELENTFSQRCNLSLVWENNRRSNYNTVELTFRYDFSFAQTTVSTRVSDKYIMTGQSARGSFAFGSENGHIHADKRTQVGRAGLTIVPFLDVNNNNRRDDDERITTGLNIRMNGGRILPESSDSIIRILDLEPFASYMLEFSDTQFDNIAWQIEKKTLSILMDPNQFKLLEIPIKVMGEINGMVYLNTGLSLRPQGRITIQIFDQNNKLVAKTQSETDGYFSYIGLAPGSYYAKPDSSQLARLKTFPTPERFDFEIFPSEIGDIIDNVEFHLLKQKPEAKTETKAELKPEAKPSPQVVVEKPKPVVFKEVKEVVKENTTPAVKPDLTKKASESHRFFIQAGAFEQKDNAKKLARELSTLTSQKWFIDFEDGLYKVRLGYFPSKAAAIDYKSLLNTPDIFYYISEVRFGLEPVRIENTATPQQKEIKNEPAPVKSAEQVQPPKPAADKSNAQMPADKEPVTQKTETPLQAKAADNFKVDYNANGYFVQAGAFEIKSNSDDLLKELLAISPHKWFITFEKGYYKVRLGYFETKDEATEIENSLNIPDMDYYVNGTPGAKKQVPQAQTVPLENKADGKPVSTPVKNNAPKAEIKTIKPEKSKESPKPPISEVKNQPIPVMHKYFIQAGAVQSKKSAEQLIADLLRITLKRWFIVHEDGLYKVRLGYFSTKEAAKSMAETLTVPNVSFYIDEIPVENSEYY